MKRSAASRRAVLAVAGATMLSRRRAFAQETGRTYRLGILAGLPRAAPQSGIVVDEIGKVGFIEGKNLIVDRRLQGSPDQTAASLAELVRQVPDVLLVAGTPGMAAAQAATRTIPTLGVADDMIGSGLVPSLARPGGNLTGISILASELDGKRQELLMELVPASRHMAALADPGTKRPDELEELRNASAARGVELSIYPVHSAEEIVAALDKAQAAGATAVNVTASRILDTSRKIIMDRSAALRLPAIYQWPETAEEGGFAAYGPRYSNMLRQLARQVVKVLRGAKPADVPVEQPTTFELVINLKTAKALGLTVPPSILGLADEVIE